MLQLLIAAVLIVCNGLFALSELAIVSSRKARLQPLADAGNRGARQALALMQQPGRFLSTVQIGITLVGILAGAFSGAALGADVAQWLAALGVRKWLAEAGGYALVLGVITYFSVVIGELVPKHLALRNPEPIACVMARPMALLSKVAAPLVWLLDSSAALVIRLLGRAPESNDAVSDEEIRALIAEAARTGVIAPDEREMIAAVMRFGDRSVRSLMTPRVQVDVLELTADAVALRKQILDIRHQSVPVSDNGRDRIIGILRVRDLLPALLQDGGAKRALDIRSHVRPAPVVPDTVSALKVLEVLRAAPVPLAIVRDEYGNFEGVVSSADILDALAGAFRSDASAREPEARRMEEDVWEVAGSMPADELADILNLRLPTDRFETVGGLIISELGDIPSAGTQIESGGWRFMVLTMDGRRVGTVRVERA